MSCLHPVAIRLKPDTSRSLVLNRFYPLECWDSTQEVSCPCGKCIDCTIQRQDNIAARIYSESKRWKDLFFLTLTYRESCLPLASSIWRDDYDTGEVSRITCPEILSAKEDLDFYYQALKEKFPRLNCLNGPRVLTFPIEGFNLLQDRYYYYHVVTPSLDVKAVQDCFKLWRIRYEREFGEKLPEFKYCICGEYGSNPKYTMRPHYHIVFMSNDLTEEHIKRLGKIWYQRYGKYDLRHPEFRIDKDGRNSYSLIALYIGKYVSKGEFVISTVKAGQALSMRFCASKNLGKYLSDQELFEFRAYDAFGQYDPWTVHEDFTELKLNALVKELSYRMLYKIQYQNKAKETKEKIIIIPEQFKQLIYEAKKNIDGKYSYPPLWYLVSRYLQLRAVELSDRKFRSMVSSDDPRKRREEIAQYEIYQKLCTTTREQTLRARTKKFYAEHSKVN